MAVPRAHRAWVAALAILLAGAAPPERPRVGLVLAGGGAKGFAHIGVIQVLEEAGVEVDIVVGTSMGAIVGGLYASGYSGSALEAAVRDIDWDTVFVDATPRRDLSIRRKGDDYGFLADPRLRLDRGTPRLPRGVFAGQRLMLVLRRLGLPATGIRDFDQLPVPYRAVAADVESGEMVVFAEGDLPVAMRASMAVPGVFPPIEVGGRLLVDGGIVDNVPIRVARALGADVVIVSAFAEKPVKAAEIDSAVAVLGRMVDLMILQTTRASIASLGPGDVLVVTDLGPIGSSSFDRAPEAIALGAAAAQARLDQLAALGGPPRPARPPPETGLAGRSVRRITIVQDTPLDDAVLRARMRTAPGEPLDLDRLDDDIARLYGLELFETVTWNIGEAGADGVDVEIAARRSAGGPTFLRFGLELATDLDRAATFTLGTSATVAPINALNGEWRTQFALGRRFGLVTELYQPLDAGARFFVAPAATFVDRGVALFEEEAPAFDARVMEVQGRVAVGVNVSDDLSLAAVADGGWGHARTVLGRGGPEGSFRTATAGATLLYDDLDDLNFPKRGALVAARYVRSLPSLGADARYDAVRSSANVALGAGRHTAVLGQITELTLDGRLDAARRFELGGPFRMSGLLPGALSGDAALLSRLIYLFEARRVGAPPFEFSAYLGATLEYGGVFEALDAVRASGLRVGGNAFVGLDAYVGPVYLGYGYTEGGAGALFLSIGGLF